MNNFWINFAVKSLSHIRDFKTKFFYWNLPFTETQNQKKNKEEIKKHIKIQKHQEQAKGYKSCHPLYSKVYYKTIVTLRWHMSTIPAT